VHEEWEVSRTQNQRRKFCKAAFLSYTRMREWQDLHAQLTSALADIEAVRILRKLRRLRGHPSLHPLRLARPRRPGARNATSIAPQGIAWSPCSRGSALHDKGEEPQRKTGGPRDARGPKAPPRTFPPSPTGSSRARSRQHPNCSPGPSPASTRSGSSRSPRTFTSHTGTRTGGPRRARPRRGSHHVPRPRGPLRHVAFGNMSPPPPPTSSYGPRSSRTPSAPRRGGRGGGWTRQRPNPPAPPGTRCHRPTCARPAARHPFLAHVPRPPRAHRRMAHTRPADVLGGHATQRPAAFYARHSLGVSSLDELDLRPCARPRIRASCSRRRRT
jgi:hypothetical protein